MAYPASFDECNLVLGPPPGVPEELCQSLSAARVEAPDGETAIVSCWKFTAEELAEVNRTGRVWLSVLSHTMPPVLVLGKKPFEVIEPK